MTVAVADTGVLYALVDQSDAWHARVVAWWRERPRQVVVPVTVLPEVCHLLQTRIGPLAEHTFVRSVGEGELPVEPVELEDIERAAGLMRQYADFPLGFVDATVAAVAERLAATDILTNDRRRFGAIRPRHAPGFTLHP
ncbi:MAG TPA: PIN domain-containing protein [Gemmatimonadales bacterium]|nr:PIN domain-containing protein [Gemmatimonadales bacterium]